MSKSDSEFGRVLWCERYGLYALLAGVGLISSGIFLVSVAIDPDFRLFVGPGVIAGGIVCLAVGIVRRRRIVDVCEAGIVDGFTRIAYHDATELAVKVSMTQIEGFKTGVDYGITMRAADELGERAIHFDSGNIGGKTNRIEDLIGRVSPHIQKRMIEQLASDERVRWGNRAELSLEGIHFGDEIFLPFDGLTRFEVQQGILLIDDATWAVQIATSEPNFFPGLHLVSRILKCPSDFRGAVRTTAISTAGMG